MFIFALVANATYVGSILVRTTEWDSIKANLPWLLDAIVCVLLDLFVSFLTIFTAQLWKCHCHFHWVLFCYLDSKKKKSKQIILQYIYYKYCSSKGEEEEHGYGDYVEASKTLVSWITLCVTVISKYWFEGVCLSTNLFIYDNHSSFSTKRGDIHSI